jgi:hypothetical protein
MKTSDEGRERLDSKRIRAQLEIQGKVNMIMGLKSTALELAFLSAKPHIAGVIQEALFGDVLQVEETDPETGHPLLAEAQLELWKPFFEVISDHELGGWLQDPEKAGSVLDGKIQELQGNLDRLKAELAVMLVKEGH